MKRDAGFTLLEVLIAVALATLVLGAIYGVFTSVAKARERAEQGSETAHYAQVLFDRIGRELRGAWRPEQGAPFFVAGPDRDGRPELRFATASTTLESSGRGGIAALRYGVQLAVDPQDSALTLVRSEAPYHLRERLSEDGISLGSRIKRINWRFYGSNGWVETWKAEESGALPQLVELTVTLQEGNGEVEFQGIFDLPATGGGT